MNVAVIPCRVGSRGVPLKNRQLVHGVPLWERTVRTCLASGVFDLVVISTDDDKIIDDAAAFTVQVVRRPSSVSGPTASSEDVVLHALQCLGVQADVVAMVQCTSPFTAPVDLRNAVQWMQDTQSCDCVFAAEKFHGFVWKPDTGSIYGGWEPVDHAKHSRQMRQDVPPRMRETGAFYLMREPGFSQYKHRFFGDCVPWESIFPSGDIDTYLDLDAARAADNRWKLNFSPKALFLDFDGVITTDQVILSSGGTHSVSYSCLDGHGIGLLVERGFPVSIMSRSDSPLVGMRASRWHEVEYFDGVMDKLPLLKKLAEERGIPRDSVVFVGNDINDREAIEWAGTGICTSNAHRDVKRIADVVLPFEGGNGAVRAVCDEILAWL